MVIRLYCSMLGVAILIASAYCLTQLNLRSLIELPRNMLGYSLNGLKLTLKDPARLLFNLFLITVFNVMGILTLGLNLKGAALGLLLTAVILFFSGLIADLVHGCFGPLS